MNFRTKYRFPLKHSVDEIIDQFKYDLAITYNKPINSVNEWKYTVLNELHAELKHKKQYYVITKWNFF